MIKEEFRPVIESSHGRCKRLNINRDMVYSNKIIGDAELQNKFAKKRKMILTAAPYMEQLINIVKGHNFFALLTDGEGCILNAIGDEKILSEAFKLKMIPGAYMDEESIGTNAMAVVIKTGKPVQLSGADHYIKSYHRWTCSGAPIKDYQGNLIGVLDLTGYTEQVHPHTLGMVIAAANAIEEMMKVKEFHKLQNTNNKHIKTIFNSMPVAIITSDVDGKIKIYNNKVAELLGNRDNQLEVKMMNEIINEWDHIKELVLNRDHFEQDISIKSLYNASNCHLTANPIYNPIDDSVEIIYVFEKIKKVEKQAFYTFDKIIGKNENFLKIVQYAKKIADSKSTILILGESGTGKEVFAQAIHNYSIRMDGPFLAINCGAIPKQLMELELFGYEEGAYVGAKKGGNQGKFEQADGGTILLDEIGELPLDMQIKLQRVLQEGIITRIGSQKSIPVNVRVIAATNKDLKKEVELGRFRKDLFYRLNVLPLYIPPLRERKGDIKLLIHYFMKTICDNLNKKEIEIPDEYLKLMMNYNWPGNIRELENVIELIINTETIPSEYFNKETGATDDAQDVEILNLAHVEREHIKKILQKNKGNITRTADDLGIRRNTLYNKIKKYNLCI
ncbi:sigma-54-dependent Fis family transcriptional regulator [Marinisporobacter balticus]|uniref:PAS domain S-box-containing protein n=1 Tax=Marinisporobacter balticus TaxID=2018667 RepID=A0A4R2KM61_9FIRM|nr:sigma 54-interacting transcriptional regulator [Marinisporobacter balticus]TCO71829.1 PAS domain S-box-containing protein [Marinisporobacter balticus]